MPVRPAQGGRRDVGVHGALCCDLSPYGPVFGSVPNTVSVVGRSVAPLESWHTPRVCPDSPSPPMQRREHEGLLERFLLAELWW